MSQLGLEITPHPEGWLLELKVAPGSKQDAIRGVHDGQLKVAVSAAPEKGKANAAVVRLLAKRLGLKSNQVTLVGGLTSPEKKVLIALDSRDQLLERLGDIL